MSPDVMSPSEIRAVRERLGITQFEFAQLLNVSRATVSQWERGRAEPSELEEGLIRQLDQRARQQQNEKWVKSLLALAAGGAFGAVLGKLFSSDSKDA